MALDPELNQDLRGKSSKHSVARGHNGRSTSITIPDGQFEATATFYGNGLWHGFLLEVPDLPGSAVSVSITVYPADVQNANGEMFNQSGFGENTDFFEFVDDNSPGNRDEYLFGEHAIKVTANAALSGGDATIKFVPVIVSQASA